VYRVIACKVERYVLTVIKRIINIILLLLSLVYQCKQVLSKVLSITGVSI